MSTWYETNARYIATDDLGKEKRVAERYLIDAMTCTEAEAKAVELLDGHEELEVKSVSAKDIDEIIRSCKDGTWYQAKVMCIAVDDRGREKKEPHLYMVLAADLKHCVESVEDFMHGSLCDWSLHSVSETPIVEVIDGE